ncbi:MAG TPA: hypothetical protein VFB66_28805 [Tepidisphaeraceae bacterium]|nr:hypothetical protein [Tepidisphaeraceae bacterium]
MRSPAVDLFLIAACLSLATSAPARAQGDDDVKQAEVRRQRIDALANQLSHDDWRQRDRAQDELVKFGESARIRLQPMLEKTRDPDLAARIEGILKLIEENRLVGPTPVSLKLKDATAAESFEALSRESAVRFDTDPPDLLKRQDLGRVTIDADRQPFWAVTRQVCAQSGVRPQRSGGATLTLVADDVGWAKRPYVISGLFLVTASEAHRSHVRRFGLRENDAGNVPAAEGQLQVRIEALFEPKVRSMSWSVPAVEEAVDDTGRSLVPKAAEARRALYSGGRTGEFETSLVLDAPPPGAATRLARLKATATFQVVTRVDTLQVDNVMAAKGVTRVVGPAKVVVRELRKVGDDAYELELTSAPAGEVGQWRAMQSVYYRRAPRLFDSQGRELSQRSSGGSYGPSEIQLTTRFVRQGRAGPVNNRATGEPVKLVWEIPSGVKEFRVPLEFTDLPLP